MFPYVNAHVSIFFGEMSVGVLCLFFSWLVVAELGLFDMNTSTHSCGRGSGVCSGQGCAFREAPG